MITKLTWAAVLSIVMIPLLVVGLLDPLEGLPALVLGIGLAITVRLLSRVPFTKWTWIPFLAVVVLIALTLTLVLIEWPPGMTEVPKDTSDEVTVGNPLMGELMLGQIPVTVVIMWLSRIAELPMIAGLIYYTVRLCRALIAARKAG